MSTPTLGVGSIVYLNIYTTGVQSVNLSFLFCHYSKLIMGYP